ncbi:MAG: GH12 family glycosyl hydrolase domain-containing protein, partial [Polyangia bacterium]
AGVQCGPESGYACANPDGTTSFVVTSNQPAGNTAVLTYPAMQKNFTGNPPLSGFKSVTSTFSEISPGPVGDYEVAWDCWFNDYANELMIWVDTYKQVPGGTKVASGVTLSGHTWDVWYGSSSGYLAFKSTSTLTAGTIDLLEIFKYATTKGWLPATSTVTQLSFGVEVCSTDAKDATWTVDDYSLIAN